MPALIVLVGGNGSGKSTYYEAFLKDKGLPFVNADEIAKNLYGSEAQDMSFQAARLAEDARNRLIQAKTSFVFETVFSHPSKIDFLAYAKANGYEIKMIAIYTGNPELNVARVAQRVEAGGHDVPEDRILGRIPRTYEHIGKTLPLCDQFVLLDNSYEKPFQLKLALSMGKIVHRSDPLPDFIVAPLKELES